MMATSLQEITLDTGDGDDRALLVMRDGRVAAVLSSLGPMHGELAGQWFLEAVFGAPPSDPRHTFADPEDFVAWLERERP